MADDPSGMDEERIPRIVDELQAASTGLESADLETPLRTAERRAITDILGDATVVGLGEVGHGVSELFGLRARICRVRSRERIESGSGAPTGAKRPWFDSRTRS